MLREKLVFVGTCDISGLLRGKAFPAVDLDKRRRKGVGWTHSNIMMSPFGPILTTPFGTGGDLMIVPDPGAEVRVDFDNAGAGEHFFMGDLRETDGTPWGCCPREFLRRGIAALKEASGLDLIAAFEQEFVYTGNEARPGDAYALGAFRRQGVFGETFVAALRAAGVTPDSFLPEYGTQQFEVTVGPQPALIAADHAVATREMARAVAQRLGHRVVFSPMFTPEGVGNGTHVHFSFRDAEGAPATHDPGRPFGLSEAAAQFVAGLLHHLPAICAITAPSPVSYLRLTPNRWAPTAIDLLQQDRGAALRICPVFAPVDDADAQRAFNVEFRVADASASPYMVLGAILFAGADGIRRRLPIPAAVEGPAASPTALPRSLDAALATMEASADVSSWFGTVFQDVYLRYKRAELDHTRDLSARELCERYAEVY